MKVRFSFNKPQENKLNHQADICSDHKKTATNPQIYLRHEAISRLLEMGLTIPEAASVSGHRTASMLARYAHPDPVTAREKMLK